MNQPTRRALQIAQAPSDELAGRIASTLHADGKAEPMKGLHFFRVSSPSALNHTVSNTGFCVIAQGSKEVLLNNERYHYDPAHYLLVTAALPFASRVVSASKDCPYLSMRLDLDPVLVGSVIAEVDPRESKRDVAARAIHVSALDGTLLDAVVRFVRLIDAPAESHFLAPLIMREIIFRLLMSEQRSRLCHIAAQGAHTHRIVMAMEQLRKEFVEPLQIEAMARELGMSVSSFHHHFKAVTAMSPLQFQKRLQLQEARRLMYNEAYDAAGAAYHVGYNDASHFNREYKKLFGLPPHRDIARLREATLQNGAVRAD